MQLHEVELKRKKENSFEPVKNPTTKRNDAIYIYTRISAARKFLSNFRKGRGQKFFKGLRYFIESRRNLKGRE